MLRLNGEKITPTIFPDKTSQVWKIPNLLNLQSQLFVEIEWSFENEAEFIHLAQLKALLDHYKIATKLIINYLPYGRQDKEISNGTTFALKPFVNLINFLNFDGVKIVDPHNQEVCTWLDRSYASYPFKQVEEALISTGSECICYPDKGAYSKYGIIYYNLNLIYKVLHGEKVRDQSSGNIINYQVFGNCESKNVLIVDDICDGGMTFKLLAKELLASGAKEVHLFVTHGIFSKGLETLRESGIHRIFTQNGEQ